MSLKQDRQKRKKTKKNDEEIMLEAKEEQKPPVTVKSDSKKAKKRKRTLGSTSAPLVERVEVDSDEKASFEEFELDELLLKGIKHLGWERPTQVQKSVIPLALENKNLLVRGRTGSGKTAAFVLPTLQRVINFIKVATNRSTGPLAVFIAPTKELSSQIFTLLTSLIRPFPYLRSVHLTEVNENEKSVWEEDCSEFVVTTPGKLKTMLEIRNDFCDHVKHVILDEADLLLSYGYQMEMKYIRSRLPLTYQCILTSATLSDDMSPLKSMFMAGPALTIKLKEGDLPDTSQLTQYQLPIDSDEERFAILIAMLKLKLIVGKSIIFVKNPDRCYQLNLFLHAFKIKSGILNSAMPANSRCLVIDHFNHGLFQIMIASDANHLYEETTGEQEEDDGATKKKQRKLDKEAGVSRGIDFHNVSNVINFDLPRTADAYIHRVGRTARGWNKGTALSFYAPNELVYMEKIKEEIDKMMGGQAILLYEIRKKEIDSFLLRAREALASCSKGVIREARLAEIREEALRSAKLKGYFAANPRERDVLSTDKQLHTLKITCPALGDVPDYIVPKALRGVDYNAGQKVKRRNRGIKANRAQVKKQHAVKRSKDPLETFSV
ncbi:unnamed protein product, partial [Mesorhabditis belari]|uniref:RNA helicase n=1 Tax=Mesorhabditis belari TaxID=2138241 RepID=A0AAF3ED11_9BILA